MKVNITINEDLMKRADAYAERNYLSRSGLMSLALTNYLNSFELLSSLNDIKFSMRKIADNNAVDKETLEKLTDFERLCHVLGVGN